MLLQFTDYLLVQGNSDDFKTKRNIKIHYFVIFNH